jgi:hypothetical protein
MKKKLLSFALAAFLVLGLTGCGSSDAPSTGEKSKGKCDVFECMEKLEPSQSLEEMNKIIGFEGELQRETSDYKVYDWNLSENTSISVQFMLKSNTSTISANYLTTMAPQKSDFSKWDEIKSKLNKKETITYDEFVKLVGGVQGTIKQKTKTSTSYSWYNADGGYLTAYFSTDTGKCTMASGRF